MKNFILILLFKLSFLFSTDLMACSNTCGGDSPVRIDLQSQCMCVGTKCFSVGIGGNRSGSSHFDPLRTANGTGVLGVANGSKYQTRPGGGSTSYDRDALSTGTPNDSDGRWIHKTGNCAGPSYRTKGCIAVPCHFWPTVKAQMGKAVTYCGGRGPNTVYDGSGSTSTNQSGLHPRYDRQLTGLKVAEYKEEARAEQTDIFQFLRALFSGFNTQKPTSGQSTKGTR